MSFRRWAAASASASLAALSLALAISASLSFLALAIAASASSLIFAIAASVFFLQSFLQVWLGRFDHRLHFGFDTFTIDVVASSAANFSRRSGKFRCCGEANCRRVRRKKLGQA